MADVLNWHVDLSIGVGDRGVGGPADLPTLEQFAKISHDQAENPAKSGQNFRKQWIFYGAGPLNFISPYAYGYISLDMNILIGKSTHLLDPETRKMLVRGLYGKVKSTLDSGP